MKHIDIVFVNVMTAKKKDTLKISIQRIKMKLKDIIIGEFDKINEMRQKIIIFLSLYFKFFQNFGTFFNFKLIWIKFKFKYES